MNDLDLPPRRTMPPDVRERIRTNAAPRRTTRYRAPLTVAAGVVVLVSAIVVIGKAGPTGDLPTATRPSPPTNSAPLVITQPDPLTEADLDRCGAVVQASPKAQQFAPRRGWIPIFTVTRTDDGTRIVAFSQATDMPLVCEITANTITVSDPTAALLRIASTPSGDAAIAALYVSPSGLVAGIAQGVTNLQCWAEAHDPAGEGTGTRMIPAPVFQNHLFVVDAGDLSPEDVIKFNGQDSAGVTVTSGQLTYDPANARPVGASAPR